MLLIAILTAISWGATVAFFSDCNSNCECEGPSVACIGGKIPNLDERLTHFAIQKANPPIKNLTSTMARQLEHLVSLHFVSSGLENIEGGVFGKIPRLQNLEIAHNNIKTLTSSSFENCAELVSLSLENNNIEVIENDTFKSLASLQNLSLAHNSIKSLPKYFPSAIASFNIEDNQIEGIQDISFQELTSLNLCNNRISSTKVIKIEVQNLVELCLGGPKFKLEPQFINSDKFPNLRNLQLVGSNQYPLVIKQLTQSNIINMTSQNLQTLTLESCSLQGLAVFNRPNNKLQKIKASNIKYVPSNRRPQTITLPSVKVFDLSGSPTLASLFINNPTQISMTELKVLRLSKCGITRFPEFVLLSKAPGIKELDLSHNPLHCTCSSLSWIKKYVFNGKLSLIMEEHTVCDSPNHLRGIPLITATMCPVTAPDSNVTTKLPTTHPEISLNQTKIPSPIMSTTEHSTQFIHSTMTSHYEPENVTEILSTESWNHNSTEPLSPIETADSPTLAIIMVVLAILLIVVSVSIGAGLHNYRRKSININRSN